MKHCYYYHYHQMFWGSPITKDKEVRQTTWLTITFIYRQNLKTLTSIYRQGYIAFIFCYRSSGEMRVSKQQLFLQLPKSNLSIDSTEQIILVKN